jgi:phenylpyruvate tautomerase PptA (4-oxalocrotonate tautomerase family)
MMAAPLLENAMPLVRIELPETISTAAAQRAGAAVHQALVDTMGVPPDDRFQVITRHPAGALVITPEFLGVKHTPQALLVQVYCAPGRTLQQKRAFYARTAADVAAACDVPPADIITNLVETLRENWSFGDGVAHYTL